MGKKFKPYFDINISKEYSPKERQAIAAEIIDELVSRTERGIDANGDKFKGYSPAYAKEKGQKNVDLTFSGAMLSDIELLQNAPGKIRIGYNKDYEGIGKVEGNITGSYGTDKPIKPRNFLGITDKELKGILSNYPVDNKQDRKERVATVSAAEIVTRDILMRSGFEDVEAE